MKKLLSLAALFLAISCSHQDHKISFNLRFDNTASNLGNGSAIDLIVFDDRGDDNVIGTKEFSSDEKIKIISTQNIAMLLTDKINENLTAKGFKKGSGKIVELHIEKLHYIAKSGFPVGTSEGKAAFKVLVKNSKNKSVFTKNFSLDLSNKHFIRPLESTDQATINDLLQEITSDVLSNEELLKNLAR